MLITTSMLSTVCRARPIRKRTIPLVGGLRAPPKAPTRSSPPRKPGALLGPDSWHPLPAGRGSAFAGVARRGLRNPSDGLAGAGHVFPVVKPHVTRDQRPLPDLRPHADDGVGSADG